MAKVTKRAAAGSKKTLKNAHWRLCACGVRIKYAGRGRPFARCAKCRKEK